jgi:hypothetical protein
MTRASQHSRLVVGLAILAWVLGACTSSSQPSGPTYARYTYWCCSPGDMQGWYPGKTVTLHWVVTSAAPSTEDRAVPVTLSAILTGPYSNVSSLKAGSPALTTLKLPPLIADSRLPSPLTSTFTVPSNFAAGFYNLAFTDDFGNGNSWGGAGVVQVSPSESAANSVVAAGQPPLAFPVLAAGTSCPASPVVSLLGVAPDYGVGDYPVYLSGQTSWYAGGQAALLMIASSYTGSLLVRGAQLDGPANITLAEEELPAAARAADSEKEKQHGVEVVAGEHPVAGTLEMSAEPASSLWRAWLGTLSTTGPGCFGLQVDGDGFTKFIVFQVQAGPAPPG